MLLQHKKNNYFLNVDTNLSAERHEKDVLSILLRAFTEWKTLTIICLCVSLYSWSFGILLYEMATLGKLNFNFWEHRS